MTTHHRTSNNRPPCIRMSNGASQLVTHVIWEDKEHILGVIENGETALAVKGSWLHYGYAVTPETLETVLCHLNKFKAE